MLELVTINVISGLVTED